MPTMSLTVLPLKNAGSAHAGIGATSAAASSTPRHGRSSRTIGYCGFGASLRQAWGSPEADAHHQSPHLSQPASIAPSTMSKAMRPVVVRQSEGVVARMESSLLYGSRPSRKTLIADFLPGLRRR